MDIVDESSGWTDEDLVRHLGDMVEADRFSDWATDSRAPLLAHVRCRARSGMSTDR